MSLEMTYREALAKSIEEEMQKNPEVFIMGEDIGRYQGTFKVTRGFVTYCFKNFSITRSFVKNKLY